MTTAQPSAGAALPRPAAAGQPALPGGTRGLPAEGPATAKPAYRPGSRDSFDALVLPEAALPERPSRAASPSADERKAAAQEVRIVEPGREPGFLRGGHHSRGDQRPCHGCNAEPVELR